jgi:hypothetical protein
MMILEKAATPVKTGVQGICKPSKRFDSVFRGNDPGGSFQTFNEPNHHGEAEK